MKIHANSFGIQTKGRPNTKWNINHEATMRSLIPSEFPEKQT
jgi:hypothetical protein